MFVTQIPYVPHLRNVFHKILAFLKTKTMSRVYIEKTDVQWTTLAMLKNVAKRSVFANTMNKHIDFLEQVAGCTSAQWRDMCIEAAPNFTFHST